MVSYFPGAVAPRSSYVSTVPGQAESEVRSGRRVGPRFRHLDLRQQVRQLAGTGRQSRRAPPAARRRSARPASAMRASTASPPTAMPTNSSTQSTGALYDSCRTHEEFVAAPGPVCTPRSGGTTGRPCGSAAPEGRVRREGLLRRLRRGLPGPGRGQHGRRAAETQQQVPQPGGVGDPERGDHPAVGPRRRRTRSGSTRRPTRPRGARSRVTTGASAMEADQPRAQVGEHDVVRLAPARRSRSRRRPGPAGTSAARPRGSTRPRGSRSRRARTAAAGRRSAGWSRRGSPTS